jgi:hypothetical protein
MKRQQKTCASLSHTYLSVTSFAVDKLRVISSKCKFNYRFFTNNFSGLGGGGGKTLPQVQGGGGWNNALWALRKNPPAFTCFMFALLISGIRNFSKSSPNFPVKNLQD